MKNVIGLIFCGLCIYWAADWAANRESRVPILDSPKAIDPHEQPTEPKAILTPHEQRPTPRSTASWPSFAADSAWDTRKTRR